MPPRTSRRGEGVSSPAEVRQRLRALLAGMEMHGSSSSVFNGSFFASPPPSVGGVDLNSCNSGCARLGSGVPPPLSGWFLGRFGHF